MKSVTVHVPAKVNLTLEILGRREDGYHFLRSIVMPVSIFETVMVTAREEKHVDGGRASPRADVTCQTQSEGVDMSELMKMPLENQLAVKAMRALQKTVKQPLCAVDIHVTKRIPIRAGMAGGSADAAGVLLALNDLWELKWSRERLAQVGATVGSDVAALTLGGVVCLEGVGERVTRLELGQNTIPFWMVVVWPGFGMCTQRAYDAFDQRLDLSRPQSTSIDIDRRYDAMLDALRAGDCERVGECLHNDFEEVVFALRPEIYDWHRRLKKAGAMGVLLSGSGSAVFGIVRSREEGERIREVLLWESPGVWCKVVEGIF